MRAARISAPLCAQLHLCIRASLDDASAADFFAARCVINKSDITRASINQIKSIVARTSSNKSLLNSWQFANVAMRAQRSAMSDRSQIVDQRRQIRAAIQGWKPLDFCLLRANALPFADLFLLCFARNFD